MANPFSRGALVTFPLGPAQATDNLTSLPNTQAKGLGAVAGSVSGSPYSDIIVAPIQIKSNAAGVSANGNASLYIVCSEDDALWDGVILPNSTSDQSALLIGARLVQSIDVTVNATTYAFREFSVWSFLGFVPEWFAVLVLNNSGAAFDATAASFKAQYVLESYL